MTPTSHCFPTFEEFFHAVHSGKCPFRWQRRLAAEVGDFGWPDAIGVPTGMGKTACLDIAVWALAKQASLPPEERSAATRIWYVVNRRLLVDAAHSHGCFLERVLAEPANLRADFPEASDTDMAAVTAVRDALRGMAAIPVDPGPLHVVRLRGGAELGARPPDPSQPALIFATVAMFGSRFLFRGYGSSTLMRSVDAGLAGTDALVLLDEAHLARPLARMCQQAAVCDLGDASSVLSGRRARPVIVALTATGDTVGRRFDLEAEDKRQPLIQSRLDAAKPTTLVESTAKELVTTLSQHALELIATRPGSACIVFCNTAKTARAVKDRLDALLQKSGAGARTALLTGRMREREAERARQLVLDTSQGAPAERDATVPRGEDLVVVATQTLEVGADLDFDFLVTESASVRALIQRLGRLNRLGDRPWARATMCHPSGAPPRMPYGDEPDRVWERLRAVDPDCLVLGPGVAAQILGEPADVPPRTGELLEEHLWALAKTSGPERHEAPPDVFFEALDDDGRRVSICWRAYLPSDGQRLLPVVHQDEAIEVPIHELQEALKDRAVARVARLGQDQASLETVDVDALQTGDQVVLQADVGLYDREGWNPDAKEVVLDVALLNAGALWLDPEAIGRITGADRGDLASIQELVPRLDQEDELEPSSDAELLRAIVDELRGLRPHPWMEEDEWERYLAALDTGTALRDVAQASPYLTARRGRRPWPLVAIKADAFEELSFSVTSVTSAGLADHLVSVGEVAEKIARAVGLSEDLVAAVRQAGFMHDLGKYDPRFQRWLDPYGQAERELAKSDTPRHLIEKMRIRAGWPKGGRHEALSCRLLASWLSDREPGAWDPELVLHLVASHHGHGRPLISPVHDTDGPLVITEIQDARVMTDGGLLAVDWLQPRRFRSLCERYGFWGLCLLEAILRQADHVVSHAVGVA